MIKAEDEFGYQDDKKRNLIKPRVVVVESSTLLEDNADYREVPKFLEAFVISKEKLQPVESQLDSILLKGSKILTRHAKSDYIDGMLFLIAKTYFYKSMWFQAQLTCQEMLVTYPYSEYSPDAHLLLAKAFLMQKKFPQGDEALSRAIDIAWGQKRYDALSEAFSIQAELALHFNKIEDAAKPYRRAVAQGDDAEQQARWQLDLGVILYRTHRYNDAIAEFAKVKKYSPDALAIFEADLYRAAALARLGQFEESEKLIATLQKNTNYKEWRAWIAGERINMFRLMKQQERLDAVTYIADTTYPNHEAVAAAKYQRGLEVFRQGDDKQAYTFFTAAQVKESPAYSRAARYVELMNQMQSTPAVMQNVTKLFKESTTASVADSSRDTTKTRIAADLFWLGRVNELVGRPDSALLLYCTAVAMAPVGDTIRARYMYAEARLHGFDKKAMPEAKKQADSLLTYIVKKYPLTEYASDARYRLGYTEEFVHDAAAELFTSGDRFRIIGEYKLALRKFDSLAMFYPKSQYAPKALYVAGWLYEQQLKNADSAMSQYLALVDRYPESLYAKEVYGAVEAAYKAREEKLELERVKAAAASSSAKPQAPTETEQTPLPSAGRDAVPSAGRQQSLPPAKTIGDTTKTLLVLPPKNADSSAVPTRRKSQRKSSLDGKIEGKSDGATDNKNQPAVVTSSNHAVSNDSSQNKRKP